MALFWPKIHTPYMWKVLLITSSNLLTSLDKRFTICPVVVLASPELFRQRAFGKQKHHIKSPKGVGTSQRIIQKKKKTTSNTVNSLPSGRSCGRLQLESSCLLAELGRNTDDEEEPGWRWTVRCLQRSCKPHRLEPVEWHHSSQSTQWVFQVALAEWL